MTNSEFSEVLAALAANIESAPVNLVGAKISVSGGSGGSVTGLKISVEAGGPGTRTVGMSVSVDPGKYQADASRLVIDLREAADLAKSTKPPRSWITGLLDRAASLGNRSLEQVISVATAKVAEYYLTS